jgi:hypothetical protein
MFVLTLGQQFCAARMPSAVYLPVGTKTHCHCIEKSVITVPLRVVLKNTILEKGTPSGTGMA